MPAPERAPAVVVPAAPAGERALVRAAPGRLAVGTSGYAYPEWVTAGVYPPGTRPARMLRRYAERFPIVELNHTFYSLPRAEALARRLAETPPTLRFTAKLTRLLTHETGRLPAPTALAAYRAGILPLLTARRLVAVLVQLPPAFGRNPRARRYLAALLEALADLPLAVEFRNAEWATETVYDELARRRVTLVTVDEPALPGLFPTVPRVTNPALVYVRLHGRNAAGWRSGDARRKFDYDYSAAELQAFLDSVVRPMLAEADEALVFFNNHVFGQAPRNAELFGRLLRDAGLPPVAPPAPDALPAGDPRLPELPL